MVLLDAYSLLALKVSIAWSYGSQKGVGMLTDCVSSSKQKLGWTKSHWSPAVPLLGCHLLYRHCAYTGHLMGTLLTEFKCLSYFWLTFLQRHFLLSSLPSTASLSQIPLLPPSELLSWGPHSCSGSGFRTSPTEPGHVCWDRQCHF